MPAAPVVSVLMAYYNGEDFFDAAVTSVLAQTFGDFELLVCDDGSDEAHTARVKAWEAKDARIRWLEHEGHANKGASLARALGLSQARGEFIAIIDQDDIWRPAKLEEQLAIMRAHPQAALVGGAVNYWSSWAGGTDQIVLPGHVQNVLIPAQDASVHVYPLGDGKAPTPSDVLMRRDALIAVGGFVAGFTGDYAMCEDQTFLFKLYLDYPVWFSDKVWLDYRQHPESVMATAIREGRYDLARSYLLDWLEAYVTARPGHTPWPVRIALDNALGSYRPNLGFKLARRARLIASKFA